MNTTLPNVVLLRDLIMIRPMPLALKKTAEGIIVPGDVDKMSPKRATVVAAGPGIYLKGGTFVPNRCKVGDNVLYMERNLIPTKVGGEDFFILQQEDVILKMGQTILDEDEVPEMTDGAYQAETFRRKLITKLKSAGLIRVQDMLNPVENFITTDGETVVATARSFMVDEETLNEPFTPEEGVVAFSMYQANYVTVGEVHRVVIRLAFLKTVDVTLG